MKFKTSENTEVSYNITRYLVNWNAVYLRGGKKKLGQGQFQLKQFLKKYWGGHVVLEEFKLPYSRCSIDIVNLTVQQAIEFDGAQHISYMPGFFHKTKLDFYNQQLRDLEKEKWCRLNGIELIRIFPADAITKKGLTKKGLRL